MRHSGSQSRAVGVPRAPSPTRRQSHITLAPSEPHHSRAVHAPSELHHSRAVRVPLETVDAAGVPQQLGAQAQPTDERLADVHGPLGRLTEPQLPATSGRRHTSAGAGEAPADVNEAENHLD